MDRIDTKLFDLGFKEQHIGDSSAGYWRNLGANEYSQMVEITNLDGKGDILIGSMVLGRSCEANLCCMAPLTMEEARLFYGKARKLKAIWRVKLVKGRISRWFHKVSGSERGLDDRI